MQLAAAEDKKKLVYFWPSSNWPGTRYAEQKANSDGISLWVGTKRRANNSIVLKV